MRNVGNIGDPRELNGFPVFDAQGEKVGAVHGYDEVSHYFLVTKGWFFPKDTYVPLDVVERTDDDGVYLSLSQEELQGRQWETAPEQEDVAEPTSGELRVPLYQEELTVGTRPTETGRVHIHKEVISEHETITIPLRKEQVTVARTALGSDFDPATIEDAFIERDIEIAVLAEEAVVGKRISGVEEVVIHKEVTTARERVTDTVRKEQVRIEDEGRTGLPATAASDPDMSRQRSKKRHKH